MISHKINRRNFVVTAATAGMALVWSKTLLAQVAATPGSGSSLITVGELNLSDASPLFGFLIPTYNNAVNRPPTHHIGTTLLPGEDPPSDPTPTPTPVSIGGIINSVNVWPLSLRIAIKGSNINAPRAVNIKLGSQTLHPKPGDAEVIFTYSGGDFLELVITVDGKNVPNLLGIKTTSKITGQIKPTYQLLGLIYAPPGTNGGKSQSYVDYGTGSTLGTTMSTEDSYKEGLVVTVTDTIGSKESGVSTSASFGITGTEDDKSSVDVKKSQNYDITCYGPPVDGLDHNSDMFILLLNPLVNITVNNGTNVNWDLSFDGPNMIIQEIYVGWLKDPSTMPKGDKAQLDACGLTSKDYAQLLNANPFALGSTAIDSDRFQLQPRSIPYNPPYAANGTAAPHKEVWSNTITNSNTETTSVEIQVGFTVTVASGIPNIGSVALEVAATFVWTNTSSLVTTNAATQSASFNIGGPAFGYNGLPEIFVYWDTIYNVYMFAFPTTDPVATGVVTDSTGNIVANQIVLLKSGSKTLQTSTGADGSYRFYGLQSGPGILSVANQEFPVTIGNGNSKASIKLN
jgi:hypothetical protein